MAGNRLLSTSIAVLQPVADAHVSKTRQRYTRAGTQIDGQTECARTRVACLALGKTHAGVRAAVVQNEHCEQDAAARDPNVCERDDHKRNRLGRGKAQGVGKHQLEGAPGSSTEATAFDRCTGSNQRGFSGCDISLLRRCRARLEMSYRYRCMRRTRCSEHISQGSIGSSGQPSSGRRPACLSAAALQSVCRYTCSDQREYKSI